MELYTVDIWSLLISLQAYRPSWASLKRQSFIYIKQETQSISDYHLLKRVTALQER